MNFSILIKLLCIGRHSNMNSFVNSTVIAETNYGLIKGILTLSLFNDIFYSFHGIPYARPPLGELRFKDPQLAQPWSGIWDATRESSPCLHRDQFSGQYVGSEDCLHLNVYTQDTMPSRLKPVIVFIHGGAFMFGSSSVNSTGPDYIMQKDVVLVTLNFRQGIFGFLSVSDDSFNIPGNFGLKDQSFALRWIKENIQNFGGDPNNVLLFGYSSGACAVHYHMLSDWSKNLFHKAVVMSGSVLNTRFDVPEAKDFYVERLAALVGWNMTGGLQTAVDILSTANSSVIVRAQFQPNFLLSEDLMKGIRFPYGPVVESKISGFMPIDPKLRARDSWSKHIPVLLSSASDEALLLRPAAAAQGESLLSTIDFTKLVPSDIGRVLSDAEYGIMGEKIRNFYFKDENAIQEQILDDYVRMETDRLYVHGMYRMAMARLRENPKQTTYVYRFNVESPTLNHFRILKCGQQCRGVCHGDDLSYIFRNVHVKTIDDIGENEKIAISRMVSILNNFANNEPSSNNDGAEWLALNDQDRGNNEFKCLNIARNLTFIDLPEMGGMQLWTSFYATDHLT